MNDTQTPGVLASRAAPWSRGAGWVVDGFRAFGDQWGTWLLVALVLVLGSMVLSLVPLFGQLATTLLMPVFAGGLMLGLERQARQGRPLAVSDLFTAFEGPAVGHLMLVGIASIVLHIVAIGIGLAVTLVMAGAGFLASLAQSEAMLADAIALEFSVGLLVGLLVYVALAIPITMLLWFAPALIAIEGESAPSAMGHSFVGCLRNFGPYLVYGLVGLVLFPLLLVVTLGLGFLVLVPVGIASIHAAYRDIFHRA